MSGELPELPVGEWWRYLINAVGALLLAVGVGSVLLDARLTEEELLQVASLIVLCVLLIVVGTRISLDIADQTDAFRVLAWMSGGVLALGALGAWARVVVPTAETAFEMALLFLSALAAGALFGAVVGYYNVQVRGLVERASREEARREFLDEQQEALSALNGILRHQILNDLSAISGRAELLDAEKLDTEDAVDSIVDHCEHMSETVDRIETFVDVLTWVTDTTTSPVGEAIDRALSALEDEYPGAEVAVEGDTEVAVLADELLYLAVHEVLENAFTHGEPPVTVAVETVDGRVTIAVSDTGKDVDVSPPETLFEPNTRGAASDGDGLGLFLADLIIDRYDGAIRLADADTTTFEIEVPTADSRVAAASPVET